MQVDRWDDWQAKAALRPKSSFLDPTTVTSTQPPTTPIKQKKKSIFGRKKKDENANAEALNQELQSHRTQEEQLEMEAFFARYSRIRKNLHILHLLKDQLDKNNRAQAAAADEASLSRCDEIAEALSAEMTKVSAVIRRELTELKAENDRLQLIAPVGSGYMRIRTVQYASLLRQFTTGMATFQSEQRAGQEQVRDTVKRQLKIVNPNLQEEELDRISDPQSADANMLRSSLFAMASRTSAQAVLDQVNARRQSMMRVEQGIAQLAQLYTDMYTLLNQQQANLDSLETFITSTVDYLDTAAGEMETAVEHQKNIRKMKCFII